MASAQLHFVEAEVIDTEASALSDAEAVRSIALLALVEDHDVSVRLRNSIFGAAAANALPLTTIGDYIDAGAEAQTIMLRNVRNFGRKTARELDALVKASCAGQLELLVRSNAAPPALNQAALLELFAGETVEALIADEILSARLTNVLKQPALRSLSFVEVLENFQLTLATMLRQPNCGRKSANEFRQFCQRHIRSRLISRGHGDPEPLIAWLLGGPAPKGVASPLVLDEAPYGCDADSVAFIDPHAAPDHATLRARLDWLLGELDDRARMILHRRNGIGQATCETLEEIGADLRVTRERIRQIEAKSLKRLRIRVRRAPIQNLLLADGAEVWSALAGDADVLRRADLYERRKHLPPHVRLAIDISEMTIDRLLDEIAQAYPYGWLAPGVDAAAIETAGAQMQAAETSPLPQPLARFADDAAAARTAAIALLGKPVCCDYLMPPRVGPRLTRLVRLHALLAAMPEPMLLERLVRHYRATFTDDPCSERDAEIVMDAAPHLFLEIAEGSWSAIGAAGTRFVAADPAPAVTDEPFEEDGTIAHALQITLAARGPTRLVELLDDAGDILPDGRSINSIGPVLLTRRELFVRALPGVYALPRHIAECRASMPECWPLLFNDYQARMYALARYAGEPRAIFPLWSSDVEFELCRWARHSGGEGILASLLSVATIDDWPVDDEAADEWRRVQLQSARFELGSSLRHAAAYERPALDRVFAACRHAAATGQFNWVAGNRLTGRKIDSHGGAGLVALLLRLGAIEEAGQAGYRWQRPHVATPRAAALADQLDEAFSRAGDAADWDSPTGQDLAVLATHNDVDDWVDGTAFAAMFSHTSPSRLIDAEDDDPLEQLLAAQRRARESERREATLDWLLED